jgi:hypothetical protein
MTTTTETPLVKILKQIDKYHDDVVLSDGATDWAIDNLIHAIQTADEPDTAEYAQGCTKDGRLTVVRLEAGWRQSPPVYTQVF